MTRCLIAEGGKAAVREFTTLLCRPDNECFLKGERLNFLIHHPRVRKAMIAQKVRIETPARSSSRNRHDHAALDGMLLYCFSNAGTRREQKSLSTEMAENECYILCTLHEMNQAIFDAMHTLLLQDALESVAHHKAADVHAFFRFLLPGMKGTKAPVLLRNHLYESVAARDLGFEARLVAALRAASTCNMLEVIVCASLSQQQAKARKAYLSENPPC